MANWNEKPRPPEQSLRKPEVWSRNESRKIVRSSSVIASRLEQVNRMRDNLGWPINRFSSRFGLNVDTRLLIASQGASGWVARVGTPVGPANRPRWSTSKSRDDVTIVALPGHWR